MKAVNGVRALGALSILVSFVGCGGGVVVAPTPTPLAAVVTTAPSALPSAPLPRTLVIDAPFAVMNPRYLSPDGRLLAVAGSEHGTIELLRPASGHLVGALEGLGHDPSFGAFGPDHIFVAADYETLAIWDLVGPKLLAKFTLRTSPRHPPNVVRGDGDRVVTDIAGGFTLVVDLSNGATTQTLQSGYPAGTDRSVIGVSASGKRLVMLERIASAAAPEEDAASKRRVLVVDAASGKDLAAFDGERSFGMSADDHFVGVTRGSDDFVGDIEKSGAQKIDGIRPAFGPSGAWLAFVGNDWSARVWDLGGGAPIKLGSAAHVAWTHDGGLAAVPGQSPYAMQIARAPFTSPGVAMPVLKMESGFLLSRTSEAAILATDDGKLTVVDTKSGAVLSKSKDDGEWGYCAAGFPRPEASGAMETEGPVFLCGDSSAWDFAEKSPSRIKVSIARSWSVALEDPKRVVGTCDQGVVVWDLEHDKQNFVSAPRPIETTQEGALRLVRSNGRVVVADAEGKKNLDVEASEATLSADGKHLATASRKKVELWDVARGAKLASIDAPEDVEGLAFRPDGTALLVNGWASDGDAGNFSLLFDVADAEHPKQLKLFKAPMAGFFSDGTRLAVSGNRVTELYDAKTLKRTGQLRFYPGQPAIPAISRDGAKAIVPEFKTMDSSGGGMWIRAHIVDVKSGKEAAVIALERFVRYTFADEGRTVVLETLEEGTHVYDAVTGAEKPAPVARPEAKNKALELATPKGPVHVFVTQGSDRCGLVAIDAAGHFDGEPLASVRLRVGDDLRAASFVESGAEFEAQRSGGLVH